MHSPVIHRLSNGVRVLVDTSDAFQSAAVGLWCTTGSANEFESEAGISHFIEHLLFKGTKNRTSQEIAMDIEGRGGDLNAFTDKELTCYYCRVLSDDTAHGIEVLTDMMTNSLLSQSDVDLERGVILEEIIRSIDEPSSYVHDLHIGCRWPGHVLGKPVIGTAASVTKIQPDDMRAYMSRRYHGPRVLLAVSGNCDVDEVVNCAERFLGSLPPSEPDPALSAPQASAEVHEWKSATEGVHFCIGGGGLAAGDDRQYALAVLDTALGGNMSSRLFQEVREKRGLVYSIGSYHLSYGSAGTFTVYGGTSPTNWPKVRELVLQEFEKVIEHGLLPEELERVKRSLAGSLVLRLEGLSPRMHRMVRNQLTHGRFISIQETLDRVKAITADDVQSLARELLAPDGISITTISPDGTVPLPS